MMSDEGLDCWSVCDGGGRCNWCGFDNGFCCSANPDNSHLNGDCKSEHLVPLKVYGQQTGKWFHMCVKPKGKCINWLQIIPTWKINKELEANFSPHFSVELVRGAK